MNTMRGSAEHRGKHLPPLTAGCERLPSLGTGPGPLACLPFRVDQASLPHRAFRFTSVLLPHPLAPASFWGALSSPRTAGTMGESLCSRRTTGTCLFFVKNGMSDKGMDSVDSKTKIFCSREFWWFLVVAAVAPVIGWQLSVELSDQLFDRGPLTMAIGIYMIGFLGLILLYVLAVGLRLLAFMFEGISPRK